ncbi:MAG: hypothetical protein UX01_C0019G0003 [Candidatus Collierbacteria bacterium GW2011_GWB2_45_17]|uniref:Uncharacterized protein n=1 Tax=Candidatus Collierbacteria bacterium GW2011_GWB2_45_17 TaxID=1618388 RepID=A0A837IFI1_9BACT|nr:MAG: hypothetical protein UX01_C0019G0003 [Candidatus Collierbacteria bacterium GW2011_GWB2_45_17]HBC44764.1 hypothetical protein [Candidatus Collierbacteria bacterium]
MGAVMSSGGVRRGRYFQSTFTQNFALIAMVQLAESLDVKKGVAFLLVQERGSDSGEVLFQVVNNVMIRRPSNDEFLAGEAGTNYFGVAMGKLAVMMDTDANSGSLIFYLRKGETPYRGGLVKFEGRYRIFVGFSGGTEDQDVEIARTGMAMLFPK